VSSFKKPAPPEEADETPFGSFPAHVIARIAWRLATTKHLSPQLRRRFRKRLAHGFPGPFDVTVEGIRLRAWPAENRCDRVVLGRGELPESPERRLIEPLVKPGMTFIDVGANVGVYSLFVSVKTGGTARILSLEPHPRTYRKLVVNRRLNGFDNIRPVNMAAGEDTATMELFSDGGGNIGGASLLREASGDANAVEITARPMPEILRDNTVGEIDLLKADVEGFEDRAVLPLFEDAASRRLWPSAMLIETVHRKLWRRDLVEILQGHGYRVAGETTENLLLRR